MCLLPQAEQDDHDDQGLNFTVGCEVEYFSESQKAWIVARILSYNQEVGTYNLNCKPGVSMSSIRWRDAEKQKQRQQVEDERRSKQEQDERLEQLNKVEKR